MKNVDIFFWTCALAFVGIFVLFFGGMTVFNEYHPASTKLAKRTLLLCAAALILPFVCRVYMLVFSL